MSKQAFVTIPDDMANVMLGYLRTRAAQLKTRAHIAAEHGHLDESLSLRCLATSVKQVEALMMTDRERTKLISQETPTLLNEHGISIVRAKEAEDASKN